jgi:hypothetical protein
MSASDDEFGARFKPSEGFKQSENVWENRHNVADFS